MHNPETIGQRIRKFRCKKDMTVFQLAKKMGKERSTIYRWEADKAEPGASDIGKLAGIFNSTCDEIINGK